MQAILLAAGKSSRFYPYNTNHNKAFIKIFGKTVLEHTLLSVQKTGIQDVTVIVSDPEFAKNSLSGELSGLNIRFVTQNQPLGMGDALLQCKDLIEDNFFVLNATHVDFHEFYEKMISAKKDGILLLAKKEDEIGKYGVLKVEEDTVLDIVEKPTEAGSGLRVIGIYLLSKKFANMLSEMPSEHYSFESAISEFCKKNTVNFLQTEKEIVSLKYSWDLLKFKEYFLSNLESDKPKSSKISPHATIEGNVVLEDGVVIMEGACLKGPCFVGKNSVIGNNVLLRNGTVIGENCVIGANTEMKNSIIMDGTKIHSGFIGDSIIGTESRLAAHFYSANRRLDRKSIKVKLDDKEIDTGLTSFGLIAGEKLQTGINVSTMPGVIIGNNVIVGPSTSVMKNIPDNTKLYATFKENIEKTK